MDRPDRKNASIGGADSLAIHVSPSSPLGTRAYVPESVYLFGHPIGYSVPFLRSIPIGLRIRVRHVNMAARSLLPGSLCRHGHRNTVRSILAAKLCSSGTKLPEGQ